MRRCGAVVISWMVLRIEWAGSHLLIPERTICHLTDTAPASATSPDIPQYQYVARGRSDRSIEDRRRLGEVGFVLRHEHSRLRRTCKCPREVRIASLFRCRNLRRTLECVSGVGP